MAGPYYSTVGTATPAVSTGFFIERSERALAIEVPSLTSGGEIRPQFSSTSGGPFSTLQRRDGSGLPFVVHSGSGPAIGVITPPTPWGRVSFTGSVTVITTLTVYTTKG